MADAEADADFLALSARTQRAVDKAFNKGLRSAGGRQSKRRRLNNNTSNGKTRSTRSTAAAAAVTLEEEGGGGFIPDDDDGGGGFIVDDDAGGFIPDDDRGGGGFLPDDDAGGFLPDDDGGGFIADDDDDGGFIPTDSGGPSRGSTRATPATPVATNSDERIPLRLVPSLLGALGLPADEDVLAVFRASASGWDGNGTEGEGEGAVSRRDFRAVCAALLPEDDGPGQGDGGGEDDEDVEEDLSSDDNDTDAFRPSDDDDDEPEEDDDGGYGAGPSTSTAKPKRRTRRTGLEAAPVAKLSTAQRALARELWDMLKPPTAAAPAPGSGQSNFILSRDDVKRWAREMGEMWSDEEVSCLDQLPLEADTVCRLQTWCPSFPLRTRGEDCHSMILEL